VSRDTNLMHYDNTTPCFKNCANLFLSELRQMFTYFDHIWQKDGKEVRIIRAVLISPSHNSRHHTSVLNAH